MLRLSRVVNYNWTLTAQKAAPLVVAVMFIGGADARSAPLDLASSAQTRITGVGQGAAIAFIDDVNGDGRDEVLVGAPEASTARGQTGAAFVVFGSAQPGTVDVASLGGRGFPVDGGLPGAQFGSAVANAGDQNGDGIGDFAIAAPGSVSDPYDRVYVLFGGRLGAQHDIDGRDLLTGGGYVIEHLPLSDSESCSDVSLDGGRDINGDGRDDLVIGAPCASPRGRASAGSLFVVFGQDIETWSVFDAADLGNSGYRIDGQTPGDQLTDGSMTSDLNGDAMPEIAATTSAGPYGTAHLIYSNPWSAGTSDIDLANGGAFTYPGYGLWQGVSAVIDAGDVNNDGRPDFALAAHSTTGSQPVANLPDLEDGTGSGFVFLSGIPRPSEFNIAALGDTNGDGIDDYLLASKDFPTANGEDSGAAWVVQDEGSGADLGDLANTDLGYEIRGASGQQAGAAIAAAGDFNGANGPDWAIATTGSVAPGPAVYVRDASVNAAGSPRLREPEWRSRPLLEVSQPNPFPGADQPEGVHLTATDGEWDGTLPIDLSRRWLRCDTNGLNCVQLPESGYRHSLTSDDVHREFKVEITATNPHGSATYTATHWVYGEIQNLTRPTIDGEPRVGETLTVVTLPEHWFGQRPMTFTYEWLRCYASCGVIAGAAGSSYEVTPLDLGATLYARVTADSLWSQRVTVRTAFTEPVLTAATQADGTLETVPDLPATEPLSLASLASQEPTPSLEQPELTQPLWVGEAAGSDATDGYFGAGFESPLVAVGGGQVFIASKEKINVYSARHPADDATASFSLGQKYSATATGIAYYKGEVFVAVDGGGGASSVKVFTPSGVLLRTIGRAAGDTDPLQGLQRPAGLDVAWDRVYVLDRSQQTVPYVGSVLRQYGPAMVKVFDVHTGTLVGNAIVPPDAVPAVRGLGGVDVSVGPESGVVLVGRRAYTRVEPLGISIPWASTAWDAQYLGSGLSRTSTADWCTCPYQRGTEWVWGMRWFMSVNNAGQRIDEYGPDQVRRSWSPKQADETPWTDPTVNDVAYRKRDVGLEWGGDLVNSDRWLAKVQKIDYTVSEADIYVAGRRAEHWYELARDLDHVELRIDGVEITTFTPDSTPRTAPHGTLRIDTAARDGAGNLVYPNGVHTLTLAAVFDDGARQTLTREGLRLDNLPPQGQVTNPPQYLRRSATIEGHMSDPEAGPRDWKLFARRVSDENGTAMAPGPRQAPCAEPDGSSPFRCEWETGAPLYRDGRYELYARQRDRVEVADNGPNESETPVATTVVDNTEPDSSLVGAPVNWTQADPVTLTVSATDNLSGISNLSLSDNDETFNAYSDGGSRPVSITGEGTHMVSAESVDGAGNTESTPATATVRIDHTPPITTATGLPVCDGRWLTTSVAVTLSAADQPSLSGVARLESRRNSETIQSAVGGQRNVPFDDDGPQTLWWRAIDNADNVEATRTCEFGVDRNDPGITLSGALMDGAGAGPLPDGRHGLSITATDGNGSGVVSVEVLVDGLRKALIERACPSFACSISHTYTLVNDELSEGAHQIRIRATDRAGRTSERAFSVETRNAPSVTVSEQLYEFRNLSPILRDDRPTLRVDSSDSGSGVARVSVQIDGVERAAQQGAGLDFTYDPGTYSSGDHQVRVTASDHAGHQSSIAWTVRQDTRQRDWTAREAKAAAEDPPPNASVAPGGTARSSSLLSSVAVPIDEQTDDDILNAGWDTRDHLSCTATDALLNFDRYWLGTTFEGLPLTNIIRRCDAPYLRESVRANYVSYIYGDCEVETETDVTDPSCTFPVEIKSWPICERDPSLYEIEPGVPYPRQNVTIQGSPAAIYDDGFRVEVYTTTATIVIFGHYYEQILRAANALQVLMPSVPMTVLPPLGASSSTLSPATPTALSGGLPCA